MYLTTKEHLMAPFCSTTLGTYFKGIKNNYKRGKSMLVGEKWHSRVLPTFLHTPNRYPEDRLLYHTRNGKNS